MTIRSILAALCILLVGAVLAPGPAGADETTARGRIVAVEDAGYPMFAVTVAFPAKDEETLLLNAEEAAIDPGVLAGLEGRTAEIAVLRDERNSLYDLHYQGKSVFDPDAEKPGPERQSITGTLKGADEPTGGDLPDEITVTDGKGNSETFEYFIQPEMVAVNGREVTAYFETRTVAEITSLTPVEE
ncbi:hypothetical protein GGD81_001066 [Rhodobium orientis]|uniref:DUF4426 domain-containing protein n=1 Tax=Rhodobium orientis TaxID=34017 RepID=A0A327JHV4_9HYPH|nr:hypothetical protein [Rhodobium orientis]MBB4302042.1 hypothetical protein [Rhodobium orientis]MBK5950279.1 hypothetical protein [Rhodobium orientis]RAI25977.1 hypothetical protein CH339_16200 [Rhodobium orientis]